MATLHKNELIVYEKKKLNQNSNETQFIHCYIITRTY